MARIETDPNYSSPTFSRATAATDLFKKEDVQALAAALSTHDHTTGKGLPMAAGSIPNGTITSAMIADLTVDTADLKDGAVTSAKILDGTIATGDLANNAVTNAKLGTDTARLNLLVNGGFEIWQRGNGPFTANGVYAADRWAISLGAGDTLSVSRDTANVDVGSQYCAACAYTRSAGGTQFRQVTGSEFAVTVRGRTITLSARVRTSVASAVRLSMFDGVNAVATSAYHTGSNTYETLSLTYAVASNAAALNLGAEFQQSCTAYVDNAVLVVGSVPADYAPLHPADDLARCLRYYEILGSTSIGNIFVGGYHPSAGGTVYGPTPFKVIKPVVPTVTKVGTWATVNAGQPSAGFVALDGCLLSTAIAAAGYGFTNNSAAGTYVSVEANP